MSKIVKVIMALGLLGVLVIAGLVVSGVDLGKLKQQWGAEKMYVQITENGKQEGDGEYSRYYYQLPAYNEKGELKPVTFSADKNLRLDAYLLVYVKSDKDSMDENGYYPIGRYDEVKLDEIPANAREKLTAK